ncbi:MAG: M48 family metalloprotease [Burkholderiaceae bacterium]|jgi:predicted Zn-dependent protease
MNTIRKQLLLAAFGVLLGIGNVHGLEAFEGAQHAHPADEDEQRVWDLADSLESDLQRKNKIRPRDGLEDYLQGIMDRLYPEFAGTMRVSVLLQPEVNAFATATGRIYLTEGILARLDNEAQLATLLGHEGAHFICRHAAQTANRERWGEGLTMIARTVLNSANPIGRFSTGSLGGTALDVAKSEAMDQAKSLAGDMLFASAKEQFDAFKKRVRSALSGSFAGLRPDGFSSTSVFGFNGFMEKEADQIGFERMVKAGYDPAEATKLFKLLGDEMQRRSKVEFYFFSSVAMLSDREKSFQEMAQNAQGQATNETGYLQQVGALKVRHLEKEIAAGRFDALLNYFDGERGAARLRDYPVAAHFYLGEAYRIRGQAGDLDRAAEQYRTVLAADPAHFDSRRSLGLVYRQQGDVRQARAQIEIALRTCTDAAECGFTRQMLAKEFEPDQ